MLHRSVRLRSSPYLLRDRITVLPFPHPFTTRAISAPAACGRLHPTPISRVRWTCHHLCYDRASFSVAFLPQLSPDAHFFHDTARHSLFDPALARCPGDWRTWPYGINSACCSGPRESALG